MSTDPLDLHTLETETRANALRQKLAREQEIKDIQWLMSDKRGRRLMWGILDRAGIYRTSFTGDSETFFREGARNLGLVYWGLIQTHTAEQCGEMITEQGEYERG